MDESLYVWVHLLWNFQSFLFVDLGNQLKEILAVRPRSVQEWGYWGFNWFGIGAGWCFLPRVGANSHLVDDAAEAPDVDPSAVSLSVHHFRGHPKEASIKGLVGNKAGGWEGLEEGDRGCFGAFLW